MLLLGLMLAAQTADDRGKCERQVAPDFRWITPADYPTAALRRGEQGVVSYRLQIDAEGCVKRCEITGTSGVASLDAALCPLLRKRAAFKPARDAAGKRVAAAYESAYWWIIPEPLPPGVTGPVARGQPQSCVIDDDYPAAALRAEDTGDTGFRLEVDISGRVTACTIWHSSGSALLDATTCSLMKRRARFSPARDADGKAIPGVFVHGIRWRMPLP